MEWGVLVRGIGGAMFGSTFFLMDTFFFFFKGYVDTLALLQFFRVTLQP